MASILSPTTPSLKPTPPNLSIPKPTSWSLSLSTISGWAEERRMDLAVPKPVLAMQVAKRNGTWAHGGLGFRVSRV